MGRGEADSWRRAHLPPLVRAARDGQTAPAHGFARLLDWALVEARDDELGATHLAFQLTPTAPPPAAWPHAIAATYHVTVGSSLGLALEVHNSGNDAFTFEEALHTYFAVRDVRDDRDQRSRRDRLSRQGRRHDERNQGPEPIRFTAETDRVYVNTQSACTIRDPGARRQIVVRKSRSNATVVWNPWVDKARAMPDFGDDEWPEMVCVETGNVNVHAVRLAPGASHTMTATLDVATVPVPDGASRPRPLAAGCSSFAATPFHADGEPP